MLGGEELNSWISKPVFGNGGVGEKGGGSGGGGETQRKSESRGHVYHHP